MEQSKPAPRGLAPQSNQPAEAEGEAFTPEEKDQYDRFVGRALQLIYSGETFPTVIERLSNGDPIESLANTAVMVTGRVEDAAKEKGEEIADGIIFHAGVEIVEDLAGLVHKIGLEEMDDQKTEKAFLMAVDLYRTTFPDRIDQEAQKQELAELQQADQQGKIGQLLPGFGGEGAQV